MSDKGKLGVETGITDSIWIKVNWKQRLIDLDTGQGLDLDLRQMLNKGKLGIGTWKQDRRWRGFTKCRELAAAVFNLR